ncbi:MAG: hypothetical protein V2I46_13540 [Bacteroides sp.]|jgi:hypothetical protein|nr:hypothetical protein [Bacteroides sp.]
MKKTLVVLICLLAAVALEAQTIEPATWSMFEMTYVMGEETQTFSEEMMKTEGASTDYFFMEEGKFRQTSNMSGSGIMETYEGTWKTDGNMLIITLLIGERQMDVDYTWQMKEKVLMLSRTAPDGSMKIVMSFRKTA